MSDVRQIGRILHQEHVRTLEVMDALETRITGKTKDRPIDPADAADRALLDDVLAVIAEEVERHYRFEEEVLFPVVAEKGVGDMTRLLVQEHDSVRTLADRMRTLALQARESGTDDGGWKDFRYAATDLVHSILFHIQKEEMALMQRLTVLIDADADKDLTARYETYRAAPT